MEQLIVPADSPALPIANIYLKPLDCSEPIFFTGKILITTNETKSTDYEVEYIEVIFKAIISGKPLMVTAPIPQDFITLHIPPTQKYRMDYQNMDDAEMDASVIVSSLSNNEILVSKLAVLSSSFPLPLEINAIYVEAGLNVTISL